jgi:hypothetical protein
MPRFKQSYEAAYREGHRAALLEQDRLSAAVTAADGNR